MSEQTEQKSYPTDLTDAEWQRIVPYLPERKLPRGRRRVHSYREILNAIFYILRSGCSWRILPHNLPPWQTVYHYFRLWRQDGIWARLNDALRTELRITSGREPEPSATIVDTVGQNDGKGEPRGYDAGKKVKGRKRHLLVDTLGLVLTVVVYATDVQDRDGARFVLEKAKGRWSRLRLLWADGGYAAQLVEWVKNGCGWVLEMIKRPDGQSEFQVLPRR